MSLMTLLRATLVLTTFGVGGSLAHAGPALLRTKNVQCDLSIDGAFVGSVGNSYFIRVNTGAGDHIVNCSGTFSLTLDQAQNSRAVDLPFAISTTVSIPDSQTQVIIDLPDPVISLGDAARALGSRYFYVTLEVTNRILGPGCSTNKFEDRVDSIDDQIADANRRIWNHPNDDLLVGIACSSNDKNDCDKTYRDAMNHIKDAENDKSLAENRRRTAVAAEMEFERRLGTESVAVFLGSTQTCNGVRLTKIWFDGDNFLAPSPFALKSDAGGVFHIK